MVPDRLQKNKKLLRILAENKKRVWFRTDAGIVLPTVSVPFDGEKLSSWGAFIAKGLMWHHWQLLLPDDYSISSMCLSAAGEQAFNTLFGSKIQNRVNGSLGNGVFVYRGAQGDDAALTIWEILPFGGVMLTDND